MPNRSPLELKPGLVLDNDVFNLDAKLLFPAGTELTERKIEILMMWGVESVTVKGTGEATDTVSARRFSDRAKHDAELSVQERFKLVKSSHRAVIAIRELAVLEAARSSDPLPTQS